MLPSLERDIGGTFAALCLRDQLGQAAVAIGADDEIDLRDAFEKLGAETLCHTADDAKHVARTFVALELAHPSQHALLRVIAHGTGVDQHDVRHGRIVGARVARTLQDSEHQLGVRDVHLAAVGLDVNAGHRQLTVTSKRGRPSHRCVSR